MRPYLVLLAAALGLGAAAVPPLTPDGWKDLRIGMSEAAAVRRLGFVIPTEDDGVSSYACREIVWPRMPHVMAMAEKGRITRLSAFKGAPKTDRGVGVGSSEDEVRRAYPTVDTKPHTYDDPPAKYLTYWDAARGRGIMFETDQRRRVVRLHLGERSIRAVEGCL